MFLHLSILVGLHLGFHLNINPLHLGLALLVTGIIVIIVILIFYNYCKPQVRPQPQVWVNDGLAHPASIGLDPSILETFPIFKYSEVAALRDDTDPLECSVCLSPFEADEMLRLLPKCNHIFHVTCLKPWLKDHITCPLCRAYLVPEPSELTLVDVGGVDELGCEVGNHNVFEVRPERDVEEGLFGKHKRWNSTGHVAVVDQVEMKSWERFTLRLPEEDVGKHGVRTCEFRRTRSSL